MKALSTTDHARIRAELAHAGWERLTARPTGKAGDSGVNAGRAQIAAWCNVEGIRS